MGSEVAPVGKSHPPHVICEHHATVESVDHHPLVGSPKQGASPASLSGKRENDIKDFSPFFTTL